MPTSFPETQNREWGFFGTISHHTDPKRAWDIAMAFIAGITVCSPAATRAFLDSRHGRHFADDVHNGVHAGLDLTAAIETAITRWMGWTINRETAREISMPKGLPYLKGFVLYFSLKAQAA